MGYGRRPEGGTYKRQEVMRARKGGRRKSRHRGSLSGEDWRAFSRGVHPTCLSSPFVTHVHSDGCESIKQDQITCTVFLFLNIFI